MQAQNMQTPSPSSAKARAGELLSVWENRITLILGLLILMLQIPLYLALQTACELICLDCLPADAIWGSALAVALYGVMLVLGMMFVTMPAVIGFLTVAARIADGGSVELADLFGIYASKERYSEAVCLSATHFYPILVAVLCAALTRFLLLSLAGTQAWAAWASALAVALELAVGFVVWSAQFPMTAHTDLFSPHGEEMPTPWRRRDSVRWGLRFVASFVPSILLGILTLGIFLLWDTLPKMAVAYFCYVGQIDLHDAADDYE